jgi:hypothetical protein
MLKRLRFTFLLVLLALMLLPGVAAGKSYTISQAILEAELLPDGSLSVLESRPISSTAPSATSTK